MPNNLYIPLKNRALLALSGNDSRNFLQGLITNNINKLNASTALYALMLTPQGKFLYDFFFYEIEGKILLDCSAEKLADIQKKLKMYKLRSTVLIEDISEIYEVVALTNTQENAYADPRSASLPARKIIKKPANYSSFKNADLSKADTTDYEKIRINLGIPSDADMEDSFPLDYEMDTHNAIDYQKGCYVGQEVTARTHYRGTLRKKPYVVQANEGVDLAIFKGQEISKGTSKIGYMRSAVGNVGIALLRMEDLEKVAGEISLPNDLILRLVN